MRIIKGAYYKYVTIDGHLCILKVLGNRGTDRLQVCVYNSNTDRVSVHAFWIHRLRDYGVLLNSDRLFEQYKYEIAQVNNRLNHIRR